MNSFNSIRSGSSIISIIKKSVLQNVYVSGFYKIGTTIYNKNNVSYKKFDNSGNNDALICRYDINGNVKWAVHIGGSGNDQAPFIQVDNFSNTYVFGNYDSYPLFFYNSSNKNTQTLYRTDFGSNSYLVKYDDLGEISWISAITSNGFQDKPLNMQLDSSNNIYISGFYKGTLKIYNSDTTLFDSLGNSGGEDTYVIKYDTNGNALWTTRISSINNDRVESIKIDNSNNIYISGYYSTQPVTIFNKDKIIFTVLDSSGGNESYTVKYDANGYGIWARRISNVGYAAFPINIVLDGLNNIYVNGIFYGSSAIFYNAPGYATKTLTYNSANATDAFIVKYNSDNGKIEWVTNMTGSGIEQISPNNQNLSRTNNMLVDSSNNIYIALNSTSNPLYIYNSDSSLFKTISISNTMSVIIKYDTNGIGQWAAYINNNSTIYNISCIALDSNNNILVTGSSGNANFTIYNLNNSIFKTMNLFSGMNQNMFLIKYNNSGNPQWGTNFGGLYTDGVVANMVLDSNNNIYLVGMNTDSTIYFHNESDSVYSSPGFAKLDSSGSSDIFIVKYDNSGIGKWVASIRGTSVDYPMNIVLK
jgi:hypothetical protein